jgi:hypothetical protein
MFVYTVCLTQNPKYNQLFGAPHCRMHCDVRPIKRMAGRRAESVQMHFKKNNVLWLEFRRELHLCAYITADYMWRSLTF